MKKFIHALKHMTSSERKLAGTASGVVLNSAVGIYKLFLGIYYMSDWLTVNAIYYIALAIAKQQIIRRYRKLLKIQKADTRQKEEYQLFYNSGKFQFLLGISYFFVSIHTLLTGNVVFYPAYIRYVMIVAAFYKTGAAVIGLYNTRKNHDLVIGAVRVIDFSDAMVSLVVCRSVLQVMNHADFAIESSGIAGILCSLLFTVIGVVIMKTKTSSDNQHE